VSFFKRGINKKNYGYISPVCPESPHGRISIKLFIAVEVVDVITVDNLLRAIDSVGVKYGVFPLTKPVAVNTLLMLVRS